MQIVVVSTPLAIATLSSQTRSVENSSSSATAWESKTFLKNSTSPATASRISWERDSKAVLIGAKRVNLSLLPRISAKSASPTKAQRTSNSGRVHTTSVID